MSKYEFLHHCATHSTIPKGLQLNVPFKVEEPSRNLKEKSVEVQRECSNKLLNTLIDHHRSQIHSNEELAQETIIKATQIILPEFVTDIPNITNVFKEHVENLVADASFAGKTLKENEKAQPNQPKKIPPINKKDKKRLNRKSRQRYLKHIILYKQNSYHDIYLCKNNNCITCAEPYVANLSGKTPTEP